MAVYLYNVVIRHQRCRNNRKQIFDDEDDDDDNNDDDDDDRWRPPRLSTSAWCLRVVNRLSGYGVVCAVSLNWSPTTSCSFNQTTHHLFFRGSYPRSWLPLTTTTSTHAPRLVEPNEWVALVCITLSNFLLFLVHTSSSFVCGICSIWKSWEDNHPPCSKLTMWSLSVQSCGCVGRSYWSLVLTDDPRGLVSSIMQ